MPRSHDNTASSDWRDSHISLSFALGKTRNGSNHTYTIHQLVERHFTQHKVRENKDSFGFSCELINDAPRVPSGKNLRNDNAKAWPLLAYDFDDGTQYEDAVQRLRDDGVAFIGYSSFNHMRVKGDAPPIPKFRIIIFIAAPCVLHDANAEERVIRLAAYQRAYHAVASHYGWRVDKTGTPPFQCRAASQRRREPSDSFFDYWYIKNKFFRTTLIDYWM